MSRASKALLWSEGLSSQTQRFFVYSKLSEDLVDEAGYQTRVDSVDSRDCVASEQKEG